MSTIQRKLNTKLCVLYLVASETNLKGVFWDKQPVPMENNDLDAAILILNKTEQQLKEYLEGKRKNFNLSIEADGTVFQKRVWAKLSNIPYGTTCAYKDIAIELQDKNASRAVGTANGRNPLSIIVPCHRVISADGSLGGYAGGLDIKKKLLDLEKKSK
jgi:methylated-DNA-[protein]-cysteine S-methyltransferase